MRQHLCRRGLPDTAQTAAWETVGALAPDEDEGAGGYRAITRQLHAVASAGPEAEGTPPMTAREPVPPAWGVASSPPSGLFNRTLDMFGWGAAGGVGSGAVAALDANALQPHAQVGS